MDYSGLLPFSQEHRYALTAVDTDIGVALSYLVPSCEQAYRVKVSQWLTAAYKILLGIASHRGTHFIKAHVQQWTRNNDVI